MQWRSRSRTQRVEDDARTSADVKLNGKQLTAQQKYERRQDTVIHFLFVAKIFSYTKNVQKYFTRINFTTKNFPTLVEEDLRHYYAFDGKLGHHSLCPHKQQWLLGLLVVIVW